MRILHTSDWHLGKLLEGNSRLNEQEKFINDFTNIVKGNNVDMVIIAGDIYDTSNPPAKAEALFCKALEDISDGGKRCVVVIAGNHDNPDRLTSVIPLASDNGIIILGTPQDVPITGKFPGFEIVNSKESYFEVQIKGETACVIALPYPSEKRLNDIIFESFDEKEMQRSYSEKIKDILGKLSKNYREDTINILTSHLYVNGGETCSSERPIQLGGSLAVNLSDIPDTVQYTALGHLHRAQKMGNRNVYYSGSPIQYSESEIGYSKLCYLVDIKANEDPKVKQIYINNYKPIEVWKCNSIEEATERCRENSERECYCYIKIKTDRVISQLEMKEMHDYKKDIISITPEMEKSDEEEAEYESIESKSMKELFEDFYKHEKGIEADKELVEMFLKIAEGSDEDEAKED